MTAGPPPVPHPAAALTALELVDRKGTTTVSVCLPARDEAATIGPIVEAIRREVVEAVPLVDELIVVDDHSTDATGAVAVDAGAKVVAAAEVLPELDDRRGKGEALWKSLAASTGDVVVWLDADLVGVDGSWVSRLVAPLLVDPATALVKGWYRRPTGTDPHGGGRVTELVARPLISALHPELVGVRQPLGGEVAGRRSVLEAVAFAGGYGVDLGLLIDVVRGHGADAVAQVDLGERRHRHHPLAALSVQAAEVLHVALRRAGLGAGDGAGAVLRRAGLPDTAIEVRDRPPLATLRAP
ncbi:MAG TPA: glucosyl-3-phosphoglycerate synthase [Acidimicrobiales bacterium]|nr:glucosyl-3-phosphoglycerate synthase [Acidimicrobiales bacterium]